MISSCSILRSSMLAVRKGAISSLIGNSLTSCSYGGTLISVFGKEQGSCCIILLLFVLMTIALLLMPLPGDCRELCVVYGAGKSLRRFYFFKSIKEVIA